MRLPLRTVSESNERGHWGRRHKRAGEQRFAAGIVLHPWRPFPLPCVVTLTRIAPRQLDDDNLRGALKAVRDGVADVLCGGNDRDARVTWRYEQSRGKPREYAVIITIEARGE